MESVFAPSMKLSILVIEGSQAELLATEHALARLDFRLYLARGMDEAKQYADVFDLAMVDFHLPRADGAEVRMELARARTVKQLAFYYLYSADPAVASRAKDLGFDGAFPWKAEPRLLAAKVESVARLIELRRSLRRRKV